ncbi:hypothetical protein VTN77DRAFT_367 [Rasamsonia byssochlamydoides]|uniref:uncharacterized protein n=1 Tax=Rasamsonia byssochlamydoides TaxID=89139 RepID=UPI0037440A5A
MAPLRSSRSSDPDSTEGPPAKRRKYVPGGPGGGGRYVDVERKQQELAAESSPGSQSYSAPRPRRETTSNATQPPLTTPPSTRPRRDRTQSRGRYSSATAAALALQQGDGYKPREERGWEEFHPDLDIEAKFAVFSAEEVDGVKPPSLPNGESCNGTNESREGGAVAATPNGNEVPQTPPKRRPGRPPRRPDAMLNGIVTPDQPKVVPPPGPNPRERLTLPKPNFHLRDPFVRYEQRGVGQQNYVDRTMASVGYQESDIFIRHDRRLIRMSEGAIEEDLDMSPPPGDGDTNAAIGGAGVGRVEYDMDEQDEKWLEEYNAKRREDQLEPIKPAVFEITMTKIEKEWYALEKRIPKPNPKPPQTQRPRSSSAAAVNGEPIGSGEEQDSKCAVCDDGDCENSNAIVFCDGCDLAVHQECYGVPYIPEGQWLCRKCQLIGRGSPNCIFCPNTEGAFKQTNTSKWSHLLCAIWIPEVGIGNPSLMEPVTDVEKVPKSRWKLQCYICKQRMGASIQCSNKNCFVAFHVTCARRSQLYLKMKTGHGNPAIMDSHLLKAFCHKHVPPDWRKEHGTDDAYAEAVEYYKNTMQGKRWGDSQAAALALGPSYPQDGTEAGDENAQQGPSLHLTFNAGGNKRKRTAAPKTVWRLPSGAPVIPQVVLNSVIASLQRFTVRQRKQYAEDACKYWTLKREARRGAALLKRLQLQLETFSSMEMTRRNFAAMGPIGRSRLQRRIDFAERLTYDVDKIRILCDEVKKREREKLKDAELLRTIVDTVYFPIPPLLWPIFEKVQALDPKGVFRASLQSVRKKLERRFYTSVSTFSADLAHIFTTEIGVQPAGDTAELQMQISGRAPELSLEQREKRKLAKRIIKAIQPALEDAIRKESELSGKPFEKELKELDLILESGVLSRRASVVEGSTDQETVQNGLPAGADEDNPAHDGEIPKVEPKDESLAEPGVEKTDDTDMPDAGDAEEIPGAQVNSDAKPVAATAESSTSDDGNVKPVPEESNSIDASASGIAKKENESVSSHPPSQSTAAAPAPLTPPSSYQDDQQLPLAQGGIQWYMQPFDPVGTTIHEERWTGRDVMRGMSEELSELDEDELKGLVDHELEEGLENPHNGTTSEVADGSAGEQQAVKVHRTRRRWRGFK